MSRVKIFRQTIKKYNKELKKNFKEAQSIYEENDKILAKKIENFENDSIFSIIIQYDKEVSFPVNRVIQKISIEFLNSVKDDDSYAFSTVAQRHSYRDLYLFLTNMGELEHIVYAPSLRLEYCSLIFNLNAARNDNFILKMDSFEVHQFENYKIVAYIHNSIEYYDYSHFLSTIKHSKKNVLEKYNLYCHLISKFYIDNCKRIRELITIENAAIVRMQELKNYVFQEIALKIDE